MTTPAERSADAIPAANQPPGRRCRRLVVRIAIVAATAVAIGLAVVFLGGWSRSTFIQSPWNSIPKATPEELAKLHDPEALRADLDAIIALHERACPKPYLRVSKDSILALSARLQASIIRPMTRREFLPLVMELQAGYRSDHSAMGFPSEDLEFALAHGERMLPFRAEPRDGDLVVVAVAESERAIEPGDRIVRIGKLSAADHLARLRALVPDETARYRDAEIRERYRTLALAAGVTLPTEIECIRPDGSRRTAMVEGVGDGVRATERTSATVARANITATPRGEILVENPPFRCLLLASDLPGESPIALIDFPTMGGPLGRQWNRFLDQAMNAANSRLAAGLIVDIRKNGGGSTDLGEALLARVTDRPYRMASRIVWRKSPESDAKFRLMTKPMWRWLSFALPFFIPEYAALRHGEDSTFEFEATGRPRVEPGFHGPTCLLIGDQTFSAATDLADAARTYDLMLTIGQPTGGVPNSLGEIGPFQLPNSRLVVNVSMKSFSRASGDESDLGPVRPHIEVNPVTGRDTEMERAVVEIRSLDVERRK